MGELTKLADQLVREYDAAASVTASETTQKFIESLTFADADEIIQMLDHSIAHNFMGMPIWLRNLAYRLAVLQRPDDPRILRAAAYDLYAFGPDRDHISSSLEQRADELEEAGNDQVE